MDPEFEYIVVGSGAGGGTLAARLAEAGRSVLLLEAGCDPRSPPASSAGADRMPDDYDVPAFHAFATENETIRWDFFVRHYGAVDRQKRDSKYTEFVDGKRVDGVLYPRAGCLGGCTAHNAMIMVYPHNDDWNHIAKSTDDPSWNAANMRSYFRRVENCAYRPVHRWLAKLGLDLTGHGWDGWLTTQKAIPPGALHDLPLVNVLKRSTKKAFARREGLFARFRWFLKGLGDPNDVRLVAGNSYGLRYTPLATHRHGRMGTRERVLDVQRRHPNKLTVRLNALATRVLFEGKKAVGVEYLEGDRLYRAHHRPNQAPGVTKRAHATREVILSGGAFNSPQLLMLSGIGPRTELERHQIDVLVDLPGVGANLQDRYEVGVVNRMSFRAWHVLEDAKYAKGDPLYREWEQERRGVYTTNGAVLAAVRRSAAARKLPDLFCFAVLANFRGYFPGYSKLIRDDLNYMTWAILKAHTNNTAGTVRLRSRDPRDTPFINFRYFDEGNDASNEDLESVVEGIKFVRSITAQLKHDTHKGPALIAREELPGDDKRTDSELCEFVKNEAWGHHASCTCAIGPSSDPKAVLDSRFRVHGTEGLRVVDASVFPAIPGAFIVSAVYMIAEKAADAILADAAGT